MVVKIILEPLQSGWEGRGFLLGRGQDNDASHSTGEPWVVDTGGMSSDNYRRRRHCTPWYNPGGYISTKLNLPLQQHTSPTRISCSHLPSDHPTQGTVTWTNVCLQIYLVKGCIPVYDYTSAASPAMDDV